MHDFNGRGVIEKLKVVDKYIPKKKRKTKRTKKVLNNQTYKVLTTVSCSCYTIIIIIQVLHTSYNKDYVPGSVCK